MRLESGEHGSRTLIGLSCASAPPAIRAAQRGDLAAFNRLVLEHQDAVYSLAFRIAGESKLAAEITQTVFLRAHRRLESFRSGSFRLWLFGVLAGVCRSALQQRRRRLLHSGKREMPSALETLPPDQCLALALIDGEGLSYAEAAQVLGTSEGKLSAWLAQARRQARHFTGG